MKIAIIGWGALIWDRRRLPAVKSWQPGGPKLPLGWGPGPRPTLTIDVVRGRDIDTHYVASHREKIDQALADLCDRDDPQMKSAGFVTLNTSAAPPEGAEGDEYARMFDAMRHWCKKTGFDAAVWRWRNEPAVTFH